MTKGPHSSQHDDIESHALLRSLPPWRAWGLAFRGALVYPLRLRGVTFILLSAFFWSVGESGGYFYACIVTLPLVAFYLAFAYAFIVKIVRTSAKSENVLPPFVLNEDLLDDVIRPLGYLVVALLFCYLPVLISVVWQTAPFKTVLFIMIPAYVDLESYQVILKMLGSFYFPMAILAMTANEDLRAISPHFVIPAILRVPLQYMVIAGAFMWVNGVHSNLLRNPFPQASWVQLCMVHFLAKVGLLYVYCVLARILGMTHWIYRKRLGWFERV